MAMPDREKTRPWLVEQVRQAEGDVKSMRAKLGILGASTNPLTEQLMSKPTAALAVAGTLLALADAEWTREAARAVRVVDVRTQSPSPGVSGDSIEQAGAPPE
jgi:hypothetical protein